MSGRQRALKLQLGVPYFCLSFAKIISSIMVHCHLNVQASAVAYAAHAWQAWRAWRGPSGRHAFARYLHLMKRRPWPSICLRVSQPCDWQLQCPLKNIGTRACSFVVVFIHVYEQRVSDFCSFEQVRLVHCALGQASHACVGK